ncbi:2-oxoglutarate dehydrogenase E1 component [Reichenbachiella versicolor]|uniref:2-oxoglutarate dehydrogenase E1 component n=1 Tax=Reichenbachiella versicolor TaxID=1821036 RepID=UPI000D6DDDF4|nr:2-oxoglutarate dehydrogenase E1 component [Reichenbachiella versicolor]
MDKFSYIANADVSAIDDMYQSYKEDPQSVDITWQRFFEGYEFSLAKYGENGEGDTVASSSAPVSSKEIAVSKLIHAFRSRGHLRSTTNPVRKRKDRKALLELEDFGLSKSDLDTEFEGGKELGLGRTTLKRIVDFLTDCYEGNIGFEYMYIRHPDRLEWFKQKIEKDALNFNPPIAEKKQILSKLNEAVVFENFLHTKYLGQKRFSLEGGETTIPALDALINKSAELGVEEVVIGMAHRGRLNVLVNIMGKTYDQVFNEFEGVVTPEMTMGDGDVKYHMGFSSEVVTPEGNKVNLKLAPNPSHLEAVNPVVEGFVRAKIDNLYEDNPKKCMPILIHGDAAVAGQGIGYELIQMSKLEAYQTGGTIHFVINNQVGFTTDFEEARSSIYCTDLAKTVDCPVLHVNGDNPEAVVYCMKLAAEWRQTFHRDIFVDMVCYRRHGHNESDEPKFTQPSLYNIISKHANPREVYSQYLISKGEVEAGLVANMDKEFKALLQDRLNQVKQEKLPYTLQQSEKEFSQMRLSKPSDFDQSPDTSIPEDFIEKVGTALSQVPEGFKPIKQIEKVMKQRKEMFFDKKELNWASAELLAYGSLLLEKKDVRISGQDTRRGTFSHRHAVVKDMNTNEAYSFLDHVDKYQTPFKIYNSHLSEFGCMGFEFGYAMADPNAVVIWEAQFGDFANGAQVMIDQFISCSYTKWKRMNGLVLLLPHGYEGQGPEHSNARPERYLQLASGNNMYICNLTKPSNYFHMIRRQLAMPFRMPCILMSPKSLFRHPLVVSKLDEFTNGRFQEVIGDDYVDPKKVKKVLLCTGKVYFDLLDKQQKDKRDDVAIIRMEQLHPFPKKQVMAELDKYKVDTVHWVQEEPENMGAWSFILRSFREVKKDVISRKSAASPATGYAKVHKQEQEEIIEKSFS